MIKSVRVIAAVLVAAVPGGCDLGTDAGPAPAEIRLSEVAFSLEAGGTKALEVMVVDEGGEPIQMDMVEDRLDWSSSDTAVAVVNGGSVTGKRVGEAEIRAGLDRLEATVKVTVVPGAVRAVAVAVDSVVLSDSNRTERIEAVARDEYGNEVAGADVKWSSSDSSVVTVDGTGLVTARARGTATITATSGLAIRSIPVRNHQTWIRSSIPADTTIGRTTLVFHIDIDSDVQIARATFSVDGSSEVDFFRDPESKSGQRFHTGYSIGLTPDQLLNSLIPGSHAIVVRAYDAGGALRQQANHRVRVEVPTKRYAARYLGTLGGNDSYAAELNEKDEVVGWSYTGSGAQHAVYWRSDAIVDLGGSLTGASEATAINEHGLVVGRMSGGCTTGARTFLWTSSASPAPAQSALPCSSGPKDVNDSGTILINTGELVLWKHGVTAELHDDDFYTTGVVLNNVDQAVGLATGAMSHTALLTATGGPILLASGKYCFTVDLNDAGDSTYQCSYISGEIGGYRFGINGENRGFEPVAYRMTPAAINKHRQIAGFLSTGTGAWTRPFIWHAGTTYLVELREAEWTIDAVTDLNDSAVILAHGVNKTTGARGALLLTPLD